MPTKKPSPNKKKPSNLIRLSIFWAILVFAALVTWSILTGDTNLKEVSISSVISRANDGDIKRIDVQGNDLKVTPKGKKRMKRFGKVDIPSEAFTVMLKRD